MIPKSQMPSCPEQDRKRLTFDPIQAATPPHTRTRVVTFVDTDDPSTNPRPPPDQPSATTRSDRLYCVGCRGRRSNVDIRISCSDQRPVTHAKDNELITTANHPAQRPTRYLYVVPGISTAMTAGNQTERQTPFFLPSHHPFLSPLAGARFSTPVSPLAGAGF